MLRCKCRNSLKLKLVLGRGKRITNGENTRIENTDDIPCICLIDDFSLICHHLLRLRQLDFLTTLNMVHFHAGIELSGANAHERDTVTVVLIHVRLNLEHKR